MVVEVSVGKISRDSREVRSCVERSPEGDVSAIQTHYCWSPAVRCSRVMLKASLALIPSMGTVPLKPCNI